MTTKIVRGPYFGCGQNGGFVVVVREGTRESVYEPKEPTVWDREHALEAVPFAVKAFTAKLATL